MDLPLAVFYTQEEPDGIRPEPAPALGKGDIKDGKLDMGRFQKAFPCAMAYVRRARRRGVTAYFDAEHFGCPGAGLYLGFTEMSPILPSFVSTGIKGLIDGERLVKTPELVRRFVDEWKIPRASGRYCVFKRIDKLEADEDPLVIVFFGNADQITGLSTLVNFAVEDWRAVQVPFSAACCSLVPLPLNEAEKQNPSAILGCLDVTARPFLEPNHMSLAMPNALFEKTLAVMDEAFLETSSWQRVKKRIGLSG